MTKIEIKKIIREEIRNNVIPNHSIMSTWTKSKIEQCPIKINELTYKQYIILVDYTWFYYLELFETNLSLDKKEIMIYDKIMYYSIQDSIPNGVLKYIITKLM